MSSKISSGVYRIINEASQTTVRVHQHGRPLQLSYDFELLGVFEQWEVQTQEKGDFMLRNMGLLRGVIGLESGDMVINAANPIEFSIEPFGDGLYAIKAAGGDGEYWSVPHVPSRINREVLLSLTAAPPSREFEPTQLWRFQRMDDDKVASY